MRTKTLVILILIVLLGSSYVAQGQVLNEETAKTPQELYDFHIEKMKTNKTAAWVTLGGGALLLIGGIVVNITSNIWGSSSEGLALAAVGLASTIVSIPLFKAANKHKSQANIQLQNGTVGFNKENNYLGIAISFRF